MASIAFHVMRRYAGWRRRRFIARIPELVGVPDASLPELPLTLLGFCGRRDFPEQLASWLSLRRYVGRPRRSVLVSDGTLGEDEFQTLRRFEPRLEVFSLEQFGGAIASPRMRCYAEAIPMGRKLLVMRAADSLAPCLYADSDILYFPGAAELGTRGFWEREVPGYLLDPYPSLDLRLIRGVEERESPVNAGFLAVPGRIDWAEAMERFEALEGEPVFFTEQTLTHLAIRASGGAALDPDRYVLRIEDQWLARDTFTGPEVALRHYVSHIRYKMWMKVPL
jgi:hypothetical protein